MQKLIYLFLIIFLALPLLSACGGGSNEGVPTLIPTVSGDAETGDAQTAEESPRTDEGSLDGIPPTWTPQPSPEAPAAPAPSTPAPDETYVVQAGDTLAEIAERFGVGLQVLAETNDIQNVDLIEVGQVLVIPR